MTSIFDCIIVGSGIAGMTSAIYLKRAGKRVLLLEKSAPGGQITMSPTVENYPGFLNIEGAIVSKMDSSAKGGVAISVAYYLSLPIFYLGYGEKVDDFKEFDIENFVDSILK